MILYEKIIKALKVNKNDGFMSPEDIYNYLIKDIEIKNLFENNLEVQNFEQFYTFIKGDEISKVILDYIQYDDFNERYWWHSVAPNK